MTYDDETLMAYVDGELDEARRREIESALARDPELARRVEEQRALRTRLAQAFAPVLRQPVPGHLEQLARGSARDTRGKVVPFPARSARPASSPWRAREWTAMAASLILGAFLSWRFLGPASPTVFATQEGALLARGELATTLESRLASEAAGGSVLIGLSFKTQDGSYCRGFVLRESATAGFACREGGDWKIPMLQSMGQLPEGGLRPAGAVLPPAVLEAIQGRLAGEPLDAEAERAARDARWASP
jgi:hypothetical protein